MNTSFCAEQSRQSGVDIAGTASEHRLYVAIACPPPWESYDLDSKGIPENLRALGEEIYGNYDRYQTRLLLIHNEQLQPDTGIRVLFFRKPSSLACAYDKHEFHLDSIDAVAPLIQQYLTGETVSDTPIDMPSRDILICTHGSRDRCCSRFGAPIYHQARKLVAELGLQNIRIWQASHIGGHRMAPTAIDFPSARYYGYLTPEVLTSILTQTGNLDWVTQHYRGCGRLPWAAQILERKLLMDFGWQWLDYLVAGRVLKTNEDESFNQVEIAVVMPESDSYAAEGTQSHHYVATIVLDETNPIHLRGSCSNQQASLVEQYRIETLEQH